MGKNILFKSIKDQKNTNEMLWIGIIVLLHLCFLFYSLSNLSISYYEAQIFFDENSPLHYMLKLFTFVFGQNDLALRLPFVIFHLIGIILIYQICKDFLYKPKDKIMCIFIYILLPGVNASSLIVNNASLVILITLLFIYMYEKKHFIFSYILMILALFIDNSFSIFYLSLFFYGLYKKHTSLFVLSLILFSSSMYMYGFESHGKPKGYFLDTIAVYAAALSPFVLLYYVYCIYRIAIKEKKHIIWFISAGAFVFSLLFSLRQKLILEDFLPFAVICIPLMVKIFLNSYRVRMSKHRRKHRIFLVVVVASLLINYILIHENRILYFFYNDPKEHFAYNQQVAKELATYLHGKNITHIHVDDERMKKRLKFYGIEESNTKKLVQLDVNASQKNIFKLNFFLKPIARYKIIDIK